MTFVIYYWIAFGVTLAASLFVPSPSLTKGMNFAASAFLAMFGFALWPLCVLAAVRHYARS
jgi:hypothetical protein